MTLISNLLLYGPGHSGFASYVRRVMPGLPGLRLQLRGETGAVCVANDQLLLDDQQIPRRLRLLHRLSLSQHGVNVTAALTEAGLRPEDVETVYSPFCDYLFSLPHARQVITCHDLTPLFIPNSHKAWLRYRLWTPVHLRRAQRIIAISRFVADQVVASGIPAGKVEVISNGIAVERPRLKAPASYDLVMLARHDANKNVAAVVRWFSDWLELHPDWPGRLVVVGRRGRQTAELRALGKALTSPERLELVEALDAPALIALLRRSLALVSASRMEGFDYPVLEAKAEGLPTLISRIPVHEELHRDTSLLFSLDDGGLQFRDALMRLAQSNTVWTQLSERGYHLAGALSLRTQQSEIISAIGL